MDAGFELFDHTADVGVRAFAPTLEGLIVPAAQGLYAAVGEITLGDAADELEFEAEGESAAELLRDYLTELLFAFESRRLAAAAHKVADFHDRRLKVTAALHRVDPKRSSFYREVKAVTYHELSIRRVEGGVEARYIVDI